MRVEFDRSLGSEQTIRDALAATGITVIGATALREPQGAGEDHAAHDHARTNHRDHGHGDRKHVKGDGHDHSYGEFLGPSTELIFAVSSGAVLGAGFAIQTLLPAAPGWFPTACYIAAYFFAGFYTLREAIDNIRLKKFEIDSLMLVAASTCHRIWPNRSVISAPARATSSRMRGSVTMAGS